MDPDPSNDTGKFVKDIFSDMALAPFCIRRHKEVSLSFIYTVDSLSIYLTHRSVSSFGCWCRRSARVSGTLSRSWRSTCRSRRSSGRSRRSPSFVRSTFNCTKSPRNKDSPEGRNALFVVCNWSSSTCDSCHPQIQYTRESKTEILLFEPKLKLTIS